ncbi:MAG: ArsR/SmtB family transcription factor [Chloroflexota bacterium]
MNRKIIMNVLNPALSQEINQLHADLCSALADPSRILLLYTLAEGPRTVNELALEIGVPQPTASRHLKTLRERGLVSANRKGQTVEYALADRRLIEALDLLRMVMRDGVLRRAELVQE